jgi:hypothetical protein
MIELSAKRKVENQMATKWIIAEAHQMHQLEQGIREFCNVETVQTSRDNYGVLTIQIDGQVVAAINSIKPLTWRVPLHAFVA